MKCSQCANEISEEQSYVHQGKILCEDCLMDIGLSVKECDPWATYVDKSALKRSGLAGAEGLSVVGKKVYELVKSRGKVTREEVMGSLALSDSELTAQLIPLMHSDLVKEQSEGGTMYLVPVPVV